MEQALSNVCLGAFLVLPIAVLALRAAWPRRMPWWAVSVSIVLPGWLLILALAMLNETPDGGAPKVFALFFGWGFALAWAMPWLLIHAAVHLFRVKGRGRRLRG